MKIGFIGLGIMGKPMAKNLLKAGYDVTASTANRACNELVAAGAASASNAEIGETCDVVLTMLPNSPQVKEVMLGEDGVGAHMRPTPSPARRSPLSLQSAAWRCSTRLSPAASRRP